MKTDKSLQTFESHLTAGQRKTLDKLTSPVRIQEYLDATPYSPENQNRNPLRVIAGPPGALPGRWPVRGAGIAPAGLPAADRRPAARPGHG